MNLHPTEAEATAGFIARMLATSRKLLPSIRISPFFSTSWRLQTSEADARALPQHRRG